MLTLDEAKEWLGIKGNDSDKVINSLLTAADEDLKSKVGEYDENSEKAKQYMKYFISVTFTDRLGEMSNKEGSAVSMLMKNIIFNLRLECLKNETDNNE